MDGSALLYIGTMVVLLGVFGALIFRAYRPGKKADAESPKHRMLED